MESGGAVLSGLNFWWLFSYWMHSLRRQIAYEDEGDDEDEVKAG